MLTIKYIQGNGSAIVYVLKDGVQISPLVASIDLDSALKFFAEEFPEFKDCVDTYSQSL